jgi:hypothetical protein
MAFEKNFFETESCYVAQAGLKLMIPFLPFQVPGIIGVFHHFQLSGMFFSFSSLKRLTRSTNS